LTDADLEHVKEARQQARQMTVGAKRAVMVLGVGLVVALCVAFIPIYQNRVDAQHNRDRIMDIEATREENQISSCKQTNVLIEGARHAVVGGAEALLAISSQFTDAQKLTIITTYSTAIADALPYRECSAAGIKKYFANPPPDPGAK
jgi:hypothetical protein